jgi:hypothetical protein
MRTKLAGALLVPALLLAPRPAAAQAAPEQVAERYFRATQAGDWPAAAAMMHPRALDDFKRMIADLAAVDDEDEEFPRLFGLHTGEVGGMPPAQLYARVVERIQSLQEGLDEMMKNATFTVLGHVLEGDTAHVVYRLNTRAMGAPVSQTSVVSMRRDGGEWKPMLNADLQNLFAAMKAAIAEPGHEAPVPAPRR